MATFEKLLILIDETENIRQNFEVKEFPVSSYYSFEEGKRKNHSISHKVIHENEIFIEWRSRLEYELNKFKRDELIDEILELLKRFNGWDDENDFKILEIKLMLLKENIEDYENNRQIENDKHISFLYEKFSKDLLKSLCNLQKNSMYSLKSTENQMNDYIRDNLTINYEVNDQTRQGKSATGKNAGEIDIQIRKDGFPVVIIEGIKMGYLKKSDLETHINKLLINYDSNGCPYVSLIIYATMKNYLQFYNKVFYYIENEYQFPYDLENILEDKELNYSEIKRIIITLNRNDKIQYFDIYILNIG
ncbi:hypothetical protein [Faecalibacillus intestinalis]|uniref:hypothetical protein n=1 Tax=Faecalibacillus intestinalis TaxID=1982626 RepID=UPI00295F2521|nr:hypothetical protein [Faecalibacillus intestinalis]